jgi:protein-tyrosine phosphatase
MIFGKPSLRVLFLCTANVCRSPLAEALLRHRLREAGLQRRIAVASAGTRAGQPGRRPDPRVARLCAERGVSLRGIRARAVTPSLLARSDRILVMESTHRDDLAALGVAADTLDRVELLGAYLALPGSAAAPAPIPDPYFADPQGFLAVHELIDQAVLGFLDRVRPG